MGGAEGTFTDRLMTAAEVAGFLLKTCGSLGEFESFMFGSSLFGLGSDYDILIVGMRGDSLFRLKAELKLAGKELPLDVLYMLPVEATETGFVANRGCVSLSKLAVFDNR